jgi:hypothetical protein
MTKTFCIMVLASLVVLPGCALFAAIFGRPGPLVGARHTRGTSGPNGGTWTGEWTNKASGATGTARITAMGYTGMVYVSYEIQGDILGCNAPSIQGTLMLNQGVDFTQKGIKVIQHDQTLGDLSLTSKKGKARGGATGACGGRGPTWDTKTKARKNVVAGKLFVTGNGAERERTTFRLRRCIGECAG